jgi:mRNA interferase RelE/StbE
MACRIEFIPGAQTDFDSLDGAVRKRIARRIDRLAENPFLGDPLGNRMGIDLTGCYELYALDKKYRIVYRLHGLTVEIVEIIGIGKRDKAVVYQLVAGRLKKLAEKEGTRRKRR